MKLNAYTIYDVASGVYMRPFFTQADGQATRSFCDIANDENHEIGKHPGDYTLYRIGNFNEREGTLEGTQLTKLLTGPEALTAHQKKQHNLELVDGQN